MGDCRGSKTGWESTAQESRFGCGRAAGQVPGGTVLAAAIAALALCGEPAARADGFHNAALVTSSLDQWLNDVQQAIPQLRGAFGNTELRASRDIEQLKRRAKEAGPSSKSSLGSGLIARGRLQVDLSPEQQQVLMRKGKDGLEVLAFLEPKNVFPHEFPNFPLQRIPQYRQAAKRILHLMGRDGTRMVVDQLRAELMGAAPNPYGVPVHPDYYKDMLELLRAGTAAGDLTGQEVASLLEATQGQKANPVQTALADHVRRAVSLENVDVDVLIEMAGQATREDARRRIMAAARKKLGSASTLDLLKMMEGLDDAQFQKLAAAEADKRTPAVEEVEKELPEYWRLAQSANRGIAASAQGYVASAFQQARISNCLYWIGEGDAKLAELIWRQIDARIEGAADARRASYGDVALKVAQHEQYSTASRKAAMELLTRVKHREAATALVEALPKLPRELWGPVGDTLRRLTGQNFGPRAGDGLAEVVEAQKKWQEWLRDGGNR